MGVHGVDLSWKDLTYTVKIKLGENKTFEKAILKDVSGLSKHGELLAIMGPSGSGKTTLLNILASRIIPNAQNNIAGDIRANNQSYNRAKFSQIAAYVPTNDTLIQTLTVWETLLFVAKLKLHGTQGEKIDIVQGIISQVGLERCSNCRIGGPTVRGLSQGERKRASIAVELIGNPDLIFLDEPTSDLASYSAQVIMDLLKKLALLGKNIIFTIYEPNSDIFNKLDRLILLAKGRTVYQGSASGIIDYFAKIGLPCPKYSNPADYIVSAVSFDSNENFLKNMLSEYEKNIELTIKSQIQECQQRSIVEKSNFQASNWVQISCLFERMLLSTIRNPILIGRRVGQAFIEVLFFSFLYYTLCNQSELNSGVLFFVCLGQYVSSLNQAMLVFPIEKERFIKESSSGLYKSSSFLFAKLLSALPFVLTLPVIFTIISYWLVGLSNIYDWRFLIFCLIAMLQSLVGHSFELAGSFFSDAKSAAVASVALMGLNLGLWNCVIILFILAVLGIVLAYISLRKQAKRFT